MEVMRCTENTIQNKVAFLLYGYYNVYVPNIFEEYIIVAH